MENNLEKYMEQQQARYAHYLSESNKLGRWFEKLSITQDKLVFAIASGSIILSITFIQALASSFQLAGIPFLITGWILLVTTLVINLTTFFTAIESVKAMRGIYSKWVKELDKLEAPDLGNKWEKLTRKLNIASLITLILGVVGIGIFMIFTINSLNMSQDDKKKSVDNDKVEKLAEPYLESVVAPTEVIKPENEPSTEENIPQEGKGE